MNYPTLLARDFYFARVETETSPPSHTSPAASKPEVFRKRLLFIFVTFLSISLSLHVCIHL